MEIFYSFKTNIAEKFITVDYLQKVSRLFGCSKIIKKLFPIIKKDGGENL
jgi:hypothetical protein